MFADHLGPAALLKRTFGVHRAPTALIHASPGSCAVLLRALEGFARTVVSCSAAHFFDLAARNDLDVLIVELEAGGALTLAPSEFGARSGVSPVLLYLTPLHDALRSAVPFIQARHGCSLLFRGIDDRPAPLRTAINDAVAEWLGARVARALSPEIGALPAAVATSVRDLLEHPDRFAKAEVLAGACGMSRRSLDRWLRRVGLVPAGTLVRAAHAIRGLNALSATGATLREAARAAGVRSERALVRGAASLTDASHATLQGVRSEFGTIPTFASSLRRTPREVRRTGAEVRTPGSRRSG
jgi:hypothetical protein